MLLRIFICLSVVLSFSIGAGTITIEKNDSVIRNELFNEKRERAEAYKGHETLDRMQYRQLSELEVKKLQHKNK